MYKQRFLKAYGHALRRERRGGWQWRNDDGGESSESHTWCRRNWVKLPVENCFSGTLYKRAQRTLVLYSVVVSWTLLRTPLSFPSPRKEKQLKQGFWRSISLPPDTHGPHHCVRMSPLLSKVNSVMPLPSWSKGRLSRSGRQIVAYGSIGCVMCPLWGKKEELGLKLSSFWKYRGGPGDAIVASVAAVPEGKWAWILTVSKTAVSVALRWPLSVEWAPCDAVMFERVHRCMW